MSKQDSVDEVFNLSTPKELNINTIEIYFKDLTRAVSKAEKKLTHSSEDEAKEAIDDISNQLSWIEDDIHKLFQFYVDAQDTIASYRMIAEERMTEDETYEHRTILVWNKMETLK